DFSAREELASVRKRHDFGANQDTFSGADVSLAALRSIADTMPFLSEYRLVVLDGLPKRRRKSDQDVAASSDGAPAEVQSDVAPAQPARGKKAKAGGTDPRAFAQGLADYVAEMPPTTVLVVLSDEKLESDSPLALAAKRHGKERVFAPPQGAGLEQWAENRARVQGVQLKREAAKLLVGEIGDNLRLLAHEVDKLATYVGRDGVIGEAEIRMLTPSAHVSRVFDLTDALSRRDRKRALALLHELLAAGESPLGIVAMTAYQTRALLQVKALAERGMRGPQIAQAAGLAPFVVDKSLPLARQFSFAQLEAAHRTLLDIDKALKLSKTTPEMALDLLAVEFGAERAR
ncbi:MAG TPA: DNA polymerase III subunit delta, partial [Ktedonobacterales bacterium]|nr:DNA polymerase III subunit delta [Ktedonobacterales bacterium]